MKAGKPRRPSGFRLINTLDEKEYTALHALLTTQVSTGANRSGEKYVEILDYDNLPAPLNSMHLHVSAHNERASCVHAGFYGRDRWGIEREKYTLRPDEYMAAARAFSDSGAVAQKFKKSADSLGLRLTSRISGNTYIINRGRLGLGATIGINTMPRFRKTDPETLREDIETVLWLAEGLGAAFYERVKRPVSLNLKTRKPSDFYSLPPEFYK